MGQSVLLEQKHSQLYLRAVQGGRWRSFQGKSRTDILCPGPPSSSVRTCESSACRWFPGSDRREPILLQATSWQKHGAKNSEGHTIPGRLPFYLEPNVCWKISKFQPTEPQISWVIICKQNHYNNSLSCLLLAENETNGNQWFLLRVLSVEIPTWSFQLHSHLNISEWISFGEGFEHVECERTFVLTKWSMARWHHPNHDIIKSLQEARHKTQKQPIYAHLHNTLSQCWGMDGHVLRSTSHEAILRIAVKHLTYIYRYLSRSKKKTISFYCIICHMILLFCCSTLFLPFQQTICCHNALAVVSNLQLFNMSQLQSLKKSHHFFQLQRLVRSKCISLVFKPWQPCCFGTEIQYIHSPSMTTFATTLSFKSEKLNPKLCHS